MRRVAVHWFVIFTLFIQVSAVGVAGVIMPGGDAEMHASMGSLHPADQATDAPCDTGCTNIPCHDRHCMAASVLSGILPLPSSLIPEDAEQVLAWRSDPAPSGRSVHEVWRPPIFN